MYLMYVDESGDVGTVNSPTRYFILSGMIVHELQWTAALNSLRGFRKSMRVTYGLKTEEEIHAAHFVNKPGALARIAKHDRVAILRHYVQHLGTMPDVSFLHVVVDKHKNVGRDVFDIAWNTLIQRFENTIGYGNFKGTKNPQERGIIICDNTDGNKLKNLVRKMRYFNPVSNQRNTGYRNMVLSYVIEDANHRNSADSYLIQSVDVTAYLLQQYINPNKYFRAKGGRTYFSRLAPNLCLHASPRDPHGFGIVWR